MCDKNRFAKTLCGVTNRKIILALPLLSLHLHPAFADKPFVFWKCYVFCQQVTCFLQIYEQQRIEKMAEKAAQNVNGHSLFCIWSFKLI